MHPGASLRKELIRDARARPIAPSRGIPPNPRSGGVPRSRGPSRQIDRSFPRHRHKTSHTCDSICQSLSAIFHRRPHQGWNRRHRAPRLDEVAARRRRKEPRISSDRPFIDRILIKTPGWMEPEGFRTRSVRTRKQGEATSYSRPILATSPKRGRGLRQTKFSARMDRTYL